MFAECLQSPVQFRGRALQLFPPGQEGAAFALESAFVLARSGEVGGVEGSRGGLQGGLRGGEFVARDADARLGFG